tara:strand:+ start:213 stop:383 length:171 start_codon:yes stop_codon:yes gene_type:complete
MIQAIKNWFRDFSKPIELKYLEQAKDHYDLEQRMKLLERRQAPFQHTTITYSRGYY